MSDNLSDEIMVGIFKAFVLIAALVVVVACAYLAVIGA